MPDQIIEMTVNGRPGKGIAGLRRDRDREPQSRRSRNGHAERSVLGHATSRLAQVGPSDRLGPQGPG